MRQNINLIQVVIRIVIIVKTCCFNVQEFVGNFDHTTVVTRMLKNPVKALCVRLVVLDYVLWPSLRFDIIGKSGLLVIDIYFVI